MSVTTCVPNDTGYVHTASGQRCFFCHGRLVDPAVHWSGAAGDVYLHADCVAELFIRLAVDVDAIRHPDRARRPA